MRTILLLQHYTRLALFLFVLLHDNVSAQEDLHYSQYDRFPLGANPALTGMGESSRAHFRFRAQESTPVFTQESGFVPNITEDFDNFRRDSYRALSASYDKRIDLSGEDVLGVGLLILSLIHI